MGVSEPGSSATFEVTILPVAVLRQLASLYSANKLFFQTFSARNGKWDMNFLRRLPDNKITNFLVAWVVSAVSFLIEFHLLRFQRAKSKNSGSLPLVSVYCPTFNRSELLANRAIKTVLNQSYTNFEFIIVDDGSTDNTAELVASIKDQRIKYFKASRHEYRYPNKAIYHWFAGPVIAANHALDHTNGEWIARIDDDDEWTSDHLEVLLNFAIEGHFELVSSDIEIHENDEVKRITPFSNPRDRTGIGATQTWLYRSYLKGFKYNIHCWRKRYFRVNDTDLQYRFWRAGVRIGYLPKVTAVINPRPDESFVGSRAYLATPAKYENFFENKGSDPM
jgi:glycosyltransferase involved in cell wall biosynthesis